MRLSRKAAALGAATFLAAGSAAFGFPGTAAADTVSTNCGGSVTAKVGDTVMANTSVLGLNLGSVNLGTVTSGTTVLSKLVSGLLCKVTVTVTQVVDDAADAVSSAAPEPLKSATDPVTGAVKGGTESLRQAAGAEPDSATGPGDDGAPSDGGSPPPDKYSPAVPSSNSPVYGGSNNGFSTFPYGSYPMSAFASFPYGYGSGSLFDTAPGLRYGTGFDDYAPDFGLLDEDGLNPDGSNPIRNAGQADALPPLSEGGIGLPMLLAVLALAGASAGLVRTWVLRVAVESPA